MDFVLTSDLDWASEYCIEHFLDLARRFRLRPTLFVTHESRPATRAAQRGEAELGIHPNFLGGSSHGETVDQVLDHVLALVPRPAAVRCHRFLESEAISQALTRRGLTIESNRCAHLEHDLHAAISEDGRIQLPVFFEDDVHWQRGLSWSFADHAQSFFAPGLKILNFHPFFVALNAPNEAFYAAHKPKIGLLSREAAGDVRFDGPGAETFLRETLERVLAEGHRFVTLSEVAATVAGRHRARDTSWS